MNTSEVAKLLGVSASTIQRWVKQLELPMERNERGHYHFNNEDIDLLKNIQTQIQNGTLLQEIAPVQEKKIRKGTVKGAPETNAELERLYTIVSELEAKVNSKADSVASYQLLQHRREIEDLQSQVLDLTKKVESLQSQLYESKITTPPEKPLVFEQGKLNRKKKNFVSSLFGFLG
ncbi:MerR family transcriptional regulator [Neobacillus niacini]|uniref:MerR family transcriptional regulator n=1 Tax=Neobacillus niacini TaxID=86668 RepID=UPI00203E5104|nr:MerR family transcriptional regulator [Neobacillus niacini]MCM3692557.1 MerR family transcriptional regulator [Neobacillus niacini]